MDQLWTREVKKVEIAHLVQVLPETHTEMDPIAMSNVLENNLRDNLH